MEGLIHGGGLFSEFYGIKRKQASVARWTTNSETKLSERGTKCQEEKDTSLSLHYMLVAVIRPQSLPSAVLRSTGL